MGVNRNQWIPVVNVKSVLHQLHFSDLVTTSSFTVYGSQSLCGRVKAPEDWLWTPLTDMINQLYRLPQIIKLICVIFIVSSCDLPTCDYHKDQRYVKVTCILIMLKWLANIFQHRICLNADMMNIVIVNGSETCQCFHIQLFEDSRFCWGEPESFEWICW